MLVHENGVPKAMVLKDFIDDINLVDEDFPELTQLPSERRLITPSRSDRSKPFYFHWSVHGALPLYL
jgi:siderophore synthetase component